MIGKTAALCMIAFGTLLSGCVAVPVDDGRGHYQNRNYNYEQGRSYDYDREHDRDRDGVPNQQDRRPDDPRRY